MTIFIESGWIERKRPQNRKEKKRAYYKIDLSKKIIFGMFIKMKGLESVLEALDVKRVKDIL